MLKANRNKTNQRANLTGSQRTVEKQKVLLPKLKSNSANNPADSAMPLRVADNYSETKEKSSKYISPTLPLLFLLSFLLFFQNHSLAQPEMPLKKSYRIGAVIHNVDKNDKSSNVMSDINHDLFNEIARLNEFEIEWVHDDWNNLLLSLKNGKIDLLTSVGYSEQRSQYLDYSEQSLVSVWGQLFVPKGQKIYSFLDVNEKKIAIIKDDLNGKNFKKKCQLFEVQCYFEEVNTYTEAFALLGKGQFDGVVSNNLDGPRYIQVYDIMASDVIFSPFQAYVAAPKGRSKALLQLFDKTIIQWRSNPNSYFFKVRRKWIGKETVTIIPFWLKNSLWIAVGSTLLAIALLTLLGTKLGNRRKELLNRRKQLYQIIDLVPHIIYVVNIKGEIQLVNEALSRLFQVDKKKFVKQNTADLIEQFPYYSIFFNSQTLGSIKAKDKQQATTEETEVQIQDKSGKPMVFSLSKTPFFDSYDKYPAVLVFAMDITEVRHYHRKVEFMAHHDALTDLPNRLLLADRLEQSLARAKQHNHSGAILFFDIDDFKRINDAQGHHIGDLIIKQLAQRLLDVINPGDTAARLGGDEFIVELSQLDDTAERAERKAIDLCNRLLSRINEPLWIDKQQFYISCSIGVAIYPRDGKTQQSLIQRADTAMYEAKAKGGNQAVVFHDRLEQQVIAVHELENELHQALNKNQLELYYQPIVDAKTEVILGAEALMRWNHPEKGMIPPGKFIAVAEKSQLILKMGYWALEEACKQINECRKLTKRHFFIAVNLSLMQIKDERFLTHVDRLIHRYQIPRGFLELEVTESTLLNEEKRSIQAFNWLQKLGIRLSIDDFGTGYSSFNHIRKLPLDKVKIDRSFIKDIPDDESSTTVVKTIFKMAQQMNLKVVAEGVETRPQLQFLRNEPCHYIQGFYFYRPLTKKYFQYHLQKREESLK